MELKTTELKSIFNQVIADQTDPCAIARLEVVREYFTNPDFKARLEEFTFNVNKGGSNG